VLPAFVFEVVAELDLVGATLEAFGTAVERLVDCEDVDMPPVEGEPFVSCSKSFPWTLIISYAK